MKLALIISAYLALTGVGAVGCGYLLPPLFRNQRKPFILVFILFALAFPILGLVALLLGTFLLWFAKKPRPVYLVRSVDYPPFFTQTICAVAAIF